MFWKNILKLISKPKIFKISVERYEIDINKELPEEKKNEILDFLKNCNRFHSEKEFSIIDYYLHKACKIGDMDLIKICLGEIIQNESKDLAFLIDQTNKTASLFGVSKNIEHLIVPRTIQHESKEYLITSIIEIGFHTKTLKFSEDSSVKTIYGYAFMKTKIEEIHFPTSLIELKEGWCNNANKLIKISISPLNGQFIMKDEKYLLGKTDPNSDEFDKLLFAVRDIKEISIPSNIKFISSFAFHNCYNLTKVEIPPDSNLQTIGSTAFSCTNIKVIFIPPKVLKICGGAFACCSNLTNVEIPPNSNLQTIGSNAFCVSKIEEIFIPSKVSKIGENAFFYCEDLQILEISEESKLESLPLSIFVGCSKVIIMIPPSLRNLINTNESI